MGVARTSRFYKGKLCHKRLCGSAEGAANGSSLIQSNFSHIWTVMWLVFYSGTTPIIRTFESYQMTQQSRKRVACLSRYERLDCSETIGKWHVTFLRSTGTLIESGYFANHRHTCQRIKLHSPRIFFIEIKAANVLHQLAHALVLCLSLQVFRFAGSFWSKVNFELLNIITVYFDFFTLIINRSGFLLLFLRGFACFLQESLVLPLLHVPNYIQYIPFCKCCAFFLYTAERFKTLGTTKKDWHKMRNASKQTGELFTITQPTGSWQTGPHGGWSSVKTLQHFCEPGQWSSSPSQLSTHFPLKSRVDPFPEPRQTTGPWPARFGQGRVVGVGGHSPAFLPAVTVKWSNPTRIRRHTALVIVVGVLQF